MPTFGATLPIARAADSFFSTPSQSTLLLHSCQAFVKSTLFSLYAVYSTVLGKYFASYIFYEVVVVLCNLITYENFFYYICSSDGLMQDAKAEQIICA